MSHRGRRIPCPYWAFVILTEEEMSRTIRVVHIPINGDMHIMDIKPELEEMAKLLDGGYLEAISGIYTGTEPFIDWAGYCDEEGKLKHLGVNVVATMAAVRLGWTGTGTDVLCGPVILFGAPKGDGWEESIPSVLLDVLKRHEVF
jgi:hypothetical protein